MSQQEQGAFKGMQLSGNSDLREAKITSESSPGEAHYKQSQLRLQTDPLIPCCLWHRRVYWESTTTSRFDFRDWNVLWRFPPRRWTTWFALTCMSGFCSIFFFFFRCNFICSISCFKMRLVKWSFRSCFALQDSAMCCDKSWYSSLS